MIDAAIAKLRRFDVITDAEVNALKSCVSGYQDYKRGDLVVRADTELEVSNALVSGYVHRFKDLKDGRRQSMELGVPGDMIDLHSLLMKKIDHDIGCLSPCRIALFPHVRLVELTETQPHLTRVLWLSTAIDAAIHREWIVSLGIRSSVKRLAHLFCETATRLEVIGLGDTTGYDLPLTQAELSELLGITPVHVNRTLRELREEGLLTFKDQRVHIEDWTRLTALAEFDPTYLGFVKRPR